ncbi:Flp family type IVb pilin [Agromyces sp. NPDC004153]
MLKAYSRVRALVNSVRSEEEGATATEYALIIGAASIVIVGALTLIAPALVDWVNDTIVPILDGTETIPAPAGSAG